MHLIDRLSAAPIDTSRLSLEPLVPADAREMACVLADPALYSFTGGNPSTVDELTARYLRQVHGHSDDGSELWLNWIVRLRVDGTAVGYVQATVNNETETADVAWVIGTSHQGNGYAREAVTAMATWLREGGVTHLSAHVHPEHNASQGIARAIGLQATTVAVDGEVRWQS